MRGDVACPLCLTIFDGIDRQPGRMNNLGPWRDGLQALPLTAHILQRLTARMDHVGQALLGVFRQPAAAEPQKLGMQLAGRSALFGLFFGPTSAVEDSAIKIDMAGCQRREPAQPERGIQTGAGMAADQEKADDVTITKAASLPQKLSKLCAFKNPLTFARSLFLCDARA